MADILVVDDLPMHVEYLKEELEIKGHAVTTAANGAQGLKRISESRPDIVLLDMSMPVMDGIEVLKTLRADPAYETLPVILLTARKESDDRLGGLSAGADDYITKPFHMAEVMARIDVLLRIRDLRNRVVAHERQVARLEGVAQTMVTLAHHINNATQSIYGIAQLCEEHKDRAELQEQLVDIATRQCEKITAVLATLQDAVETAEIDTTGYAGQENRMLDIEAKLTKRLEGLGLD